jgi:hypothetical protein
MRSPATAFKHLCAILALAGSTLAVAPAAQAERLDAKIARVRTGAGSLEQVQLRVDWPRDAATGQLRLRAASVDFPALSWHGNDIDWSCPLSRTPAGKWRCAGPVRTRGGGTQQLALEFSGADFGAQLANGRSRIAYGSLAGAAPAGAHRVLVQRVPVAWLKAFLAGLWANGRWNAGDLDGSIDVQSLPRDGLRVRTDLVLAGIGLETPDGTLAASGLGGRLRLDYRSAGGKTSVDANFEARGGELLFDRFYAKLPGTPVPVQVLAEREGEGAWRLPRLRWQDAGALELEGEGTLDAQGLPDTLELRMALPNLALARDRYLSGFLAPAGYGDLLLTGGASATLRIAAGKPRDLDARLSAVNAVDTKARFTLAGLGGELRWNAGAQAQAGELRWDSGALFGIGLGPARFAFASSGGELRLSQPAAIEALGGQLRLEQLRWQAPEGEGHARFQFGMAVDKLDLASLSQRLGWPAFTGTISGRIPSARFQDDVLDIDGGLQMSLFGGSVALSKLSMERPFGTAPTLTGDVAIEDVDLEQITRVTGFGTITGRLDGRIQDLRLVDWDPVAFDARLETDSAWKGKKRLSQRAVKDISDVGGSGIAGGLQAKALGFFDDFGYDRIGLGCKLRENVCTMSGVGSAGDGYIIVAGSGLPRIQVVGFRRQVDWPTLVARLVAATKGQAPVIK